MREILFRGKSTFNGEWIVSDSILTFERHPITHCKCVQLWDKDEGWAWVDPDTMGQYTGLTDKNGKKIFEGDIVIIEYPEKTVVNCVIEYVGASFVGSTHADAWELDGYYSLEIIGNKHDNPELLEGGE